MPKTQEPGDTDLGRAIQSLHRALDTVARYLEAVGADAAGSRAVRDAAREAGAAVSHARRAWPAAVAEWRELRDQVVGQGRELRGLERTAGTLVALEQEDWQTKP